MDVFTSNDADQVKLEDLVGEGKKYKDVNELAKAKAHADSFIEQLKREKEEAVSELATRAAVEEAIKKLQGTNANGGTSTPTGTTTSQTQTTEHKATLTLEDVDKLLEDRQRKQRADSNLAVANEAIVKYAGTAEKGREFLATKAKELGIPADKLAEIGKDSPAALLRILGVEAGKTTPITTDVRKTAVLQTSADKPFDLEAPMTKADYDKLRREDPTTYFSPKIQNKLMKDRMAEIRKSQNN